MSKNAMIKQITVSNNKIYQLDFLKEVVLNCYTKGAMTGSFHRASCSLPSICKKSAKTKMFKQTAVSTNKMYH